jgi:hypothetical protein
MPRSTRVACGREDLVIGGSLEAREFVAFWLKDQHVQAGMAVNHVGADDDVENRIRSEPGRRLRSLRSSPAEPAVTDHRAAWS